LRFFVRVPLSRGLSRASGDVPFGHTSCQASLQSFQQLLLVVVRIERRELVQLFRIRHRDPRLAPGPPPAALGRLGLARPPLGTLLRFNPLPLGRPFGVQAILLTHARFVAALFLEEGGLLLGAPRLGLSRRGLLLRLRLAHWRIYGVGGDGGGVWGDPPDDTAAKTGVASRARCARSAQCLQDRGPRSSDHPLRQPLDDNQ